MFEFHNIWVLKLNFQLIVVIKTIVYSNIRVILWTWFILMERSWLNFLNKKGWLKYICLFCNQPSQPLKPTPKEKKPFIIYINTYKSDKSTIFFGNFWTFSLPTVQVKNGSRRWEFGNFYLPVRFIMWLLKWCENE